MCIAALAPVASALGATQTAATLGALSAAQSISLGLSAVGTGLSAVGAVQQARTQKQVAENNAKTAEWQAQDAERRGAQDAMDVQRKAAALKSSQRVSLASKGLDLGYGTAADIQDQTDFFGQIDATTARDNSAREAWARRAQKVNFQTEAAATRPWLTGGSTLLAGAGQVADKWYQYAR